MDNTDHRLRSQRSNNGSKMVEFRLKSRYLKVKKVNVGIIVQLPRDLMDLVSQRLCFAFGETHWSVSWTSVYSLI